MRLAISCLVLAALVGCTPKKQSATEPVPPPVNYSAELPPGTYALRKIPPSEYPDFSEAFFKPNMADVVKSINYSLEYLAKPFSLFMRRAMREA